MGVKIEKKSPAAVGDDGGVPFEGSVVNPAKLPPEDPLHVADTGGKPAKKATKKAAKKTVAAAEPKKDEYLEGIAAKTAAKKAAAAAEESDSEAASVSSAVVEKVQPTAHEETIHPTGVIEHKETPVGPAILRTEPMANVGLSISRTRQLKPYEPIKYSVSLYMPCEANIDAINETFAVVEAWVDQKISEFDEQMDEATGND